MTAGSGPAQEGDLRFDWGPAGVRALAPDAAVTVVVDVLRFTTAVEAAVSRGAVVYPIGWPPDVPAASAGELARAVEARLADGTGGLSLSPVSLLQLGAGEAVVLPSPNGGTCSRLAADLGREVVAACLRNAGAVAACLDRGPRPIAVIACGERWADGTLRPAVEDFLAAGAVLAALSGPRSPEAAVAASAWASNGGSVADLVRGSVSGRELRTSGRSADVEYALDCDVSPVVPRLRADRFVAAGD